MGRPLRNLACSVIKQGQFFQQQVKLVQSRLILSLSAMFLISSPPCQLVGFKFPLMSKCPEMLCTASMWITLNQILYSLSLLHSQAQLPATDTQTPLKHCLGNFPSAPRIQCPLPFRPDHLNSCLKEPNHSSLSSAKQLDVLEDKAKGTFSCLCQHPH